MNEQEVIAKLRKLKEHMTYFELSKRLNVPPGTVMRWIKTGRINSLYASHVAKVLEASVL